MTHCLKVSFIHIEFYILYIEILYFNWNTCSNIEQIKRCFCRRNQLTVAAKISDFILTTIGVHSVNIALLKFDHLRFLTDYAMSTYILNSKDGVVQPSRDAGPKYTTMYFPSLPGTIVCSVLDVIEKGNVVEWSGDMRGACKHEERGQA
jgi:hypothetical protein